MKLLIQHNHLSADLLNQVQQALADSQLPIPIPHAYVGVIPFSHEITSNEELVDLDYIPYGSTLFVKLALARQWKVNFNQDFNYWSALSNRADMLNDVVLTVEQAFDLLASVDQDSPLFIRPSLDLKQFSGFVASSSSISQFLLSALAQDSSVVTGLTRDTDVVIGKPVQIEQEIRLFIVDRLIVAGSVYRDKGRLHHLRLSQDQLSSLQQSVVDDQWLPDDCCVMDLAVLPDNQLKVIEFNCINCSGFYAADIAAVFSSLLHYHLKPKT